MVDHVAIRGFMKAYPEFAECPVYKLIARLRHATQMSKSLALHGVYERTVDLLNQVAFSEQDIHVVPASMTQQEIADRVGATREMINHVLRDLMRGGFLARDEIETAGFRQDAAKALVSSMVATQERSRW